MTTATILNGKQLASSIKTSLKEKISNLKQKPTLAVIIVGNNPASETYVRSKEKACLETGINSKTYKLDENIQETELLELIDLLNKDNDVNGILVQLPLPSHINTDHILHAITPIKDVDGFHPLNTGLLLKKSPKAFIPCTPKGILKLLHLAKKDLTGLNAVVVGRSQIVGLPIANLLINENCTVTVTHSKTKNLKEICKSADILIAALGKTEFITKDYIKENSIIIDVGINRTTEGLKGDVKFSDAIDLCSHITPVPGGVGPMTIAMLLENTYEAFLSQTNS
ncbi:MAG: bifunctional 5,10-methylenetetrahydrofolate dehydrogenase/5,10-methenyltetrahydrofolate cyclohydrolase [Alphaproteobacteria bacterium]|nr:bifunctional 5,10-methylenetetrahydrofolate dehydrogenase/5,10-methenyltetrahydrofolate cyclohydrolase [Alphaproteobacteria bacterium]